MRAMRADSFFPGMGIIVHDRTKLHQCGISRHSTLMTTAAAKLRTIKLTESFQLPAGNLKVDRDKGIIFDVKMGGISSKNTHGQQGVDGSEYKLEAYRAAIPLYEGRRSFFNHPAGRRARAERQFQEFAGCFRDVKVKDDGLYGNLHYVKGDPLCEKLATVAESMPEQVGMSHNATGKSHVETKRRKNVIESIPEVLSVDLVMDPATTNGMFESQETTVKTLKQFLEAYSLEKNGVLVKLLEDEGGMAMDAPPPSEATPAAAGDWRSKLCEALCHIVQDTALSPEEIKSKINAILKIVNEEAKPEKKEGGDTDPESTETKESVALLKAEKGVRVLCESLGYRPSEKQITTLAKLTESEQKDMVGDLKKGAETTTPAPARRQFGPRSNGIRPLVESAESTDVPKDPKALAAWLKN